MNRKISVSVALTITLIAITVTFAITWIMSSEAFNKAVSSVTQKQAQYSKLAEVDNYVRHNYYGEIDDILLNDRIAQGYLNGIDDRYSTYYSEKEYGELREYESGERVDIGVEVVRDADGYFRIVRVYEDSPAAKAGVQEDGRITYVDGTDAKTVQTVKRMQNLLRGLQGTTLKLTCLYGAAEEVDFDVQRSNYNVPTVEYTKAKDFGYLRVYSFGNNTFTDFDYLVNQAVQDGARGLVIDVRNNPGGQFQQAYQMIDLLCPRGTVAKSQAKNGTTKVLATSDEKAVELPLVVLVNENTAAAAELFAVSVRDLAGGKIVGATTAGKGSIQSAPQQLTDGSAVSITTAMLLTGKDESFDLTGVVPDVEALMTAEDESILYRANPFSGSSQDISQAVRAFELLLSMSGDNSLSFRSDETDTAATVVPPSQSGLSDEDDSDTSASETESAASGSETTSRSSGGLGPIVPDPAFVPGTRDVDSSSGSAETDSVFAAGRGQWQ